jgi:hypothetical protein
MGSPDRPSLVDIGDRRYREKKRDDTVNVNAEPLGRPYHHSLDKFRAAAKECAICAIVDRDITQFQIEFSDAQQDQLYGGPGKGGPDWRMYLARGVNDTGGFVVVSTDITQPFRLWVLAAVELCVNCESQAVLPSNTD